MSKNKISVSFALADGFFWMVNGLASGYSSVFLSDMGHSGFTIGIYFMCVGFFALISQPVWGYISDRFGCVKQTLIAGLAVLNITMFFFFKYGERLFVAFIMAAVTGITTSSMYAILDNWITKLGKEGFDTDYGRIRGAASMMFAFASLGIGWALGKFSNSAAPYLMTVFYLLFLAAVLTIPNPKRSVDPDGTEVTTREAAAYLLHNRDFLVFVLCSFLTMFTLQASFTFFPSLITDLGGSSQMVGLGYFGMAFVEFWVIGNYTKIKNRFGNTNVYNFGLFGHFVKAMAFALAPTYPLVILSTITQGFSFSFTIPGLVEYVSENIDRRYLATAQLVAVSFSTGLAQIVGNPIYGALSDRYGLRVMMFVVSFSALLGSIIFRIYNIRAKKVIDKM